MTGGRTWQDNAVEFAALTMPKQGRDIRLALLAACSVEKGTVGRQVKGANEHLKVTASEFARTAGLPRHDRVLRHLDAWERLADQGFVKRPFLRVVLGFY